MQKLVRLNTVTRAERQQTIERVKAAINASGGWILDFTLFSNIAICLNFQLPAHRGASLCAALSALGLGWDTQSEQALFGLGAASGADAGDLTGSLHITFVHDEPDLRIPVPPIPG